MRRRQAVTRAIAGALAVAVAAIFLGGGPAWSAGEKVEADWVQKPSGEQFAAAFPPMANALHIEGRVALVCVVTINGVLTECATESETPKGLGFAGAASLIAPSFRMRPTTVDGRARGGDKVRIPISFRLPPPLPDVQPGPPTSPHALETARRLVAAEGLGDRLIARYGAQNTSRNLWRAAGIDDATLEAGAAAQDRALARLAPAWLETAARGYAALFDDAQLAASLAYAESPTGHTALRKAASLDAMGAPLAWVTFRHGLSLGRDIFCKTHECLPNVDTAAPDRRPAILTPDWLEQPDRWQVLRGIPFLAKALSVPGEARLGCRVTTLGLLYECRVLRETPDGLGFGASAIELAKLYRTQPLPPGATTAPPTVELTVRFPELPARPPPFNALPAFDQDPDPARLDLARQVISVIDLRAEAARSNILTMKGFDDIASPGVDAKTRAEVRAALAAGGDQAIGFYEAERAKQFAGLFSEAELRGLLAWELSPAGQARRAEQNRLTEFSAAMNKGFDDRISRQAGTIFCASRGCETAIGVPPAP